MSASTAAIAATTDAEDGVLLDGALAAQWKPDLPTAVRRWSWFRSAAIPVLERGADRLAVTVRPSAAVLSAAFLDWVGLLEREQRFEALDPVDLARYACGMLLRGLLVARPLEVTPLDGVTVGGAVAAAWRHDADLALLLRLSLTLLDGWHRALGAPPLVLQPEAQAPAFVASVIENLRQDADQAPAFVDRLTGVEPVWRFATLVYERPAMRRALAARRTG